MRRVRLLVQYDGTDYAGFQVQPGRRTVQQELEECLGRLTGDRVRVTAASRTDAGVHALGQVVAFSTNSPIPAERIPRALNDLLPAAVSCVAAEDCPHGFHPRFDARGKLYTYRILNRPTRSPFICRYAWHIAEPLDLPAMREGARHLVGTHDFAAFCAAGSAVQDTRRTVRRLDLDTEGDVIETHIEGDGFLYMMVRIIMGTLAEVGRGRLEPTQVLSIVAGRDRGKAGPTAPPEGLCLVRVTY
ncbi:MAG: tRNA pseudouridine(38-40) synthase TruA [Armatimonadetes bacterium]|nr:tRNA pseudouridine(38-40) synthase TruA [Armatimonadota bacterium]